MTMKIYSYKRLSSKFTDENTIVLTKARLINKDGSVKMVCSSELRKNDIVEVFAGELIPCNGEIVEGFAAIDESSITGESAPVIKEAGGEFSTVINGTKVISNSIKIRVMINSDLSFRDKVTRLIGNIKDKISSPAV